MHALCELGRSAVAAATAQAAACYETMLNWNLCSRVRIVLDTHPY